LARAHSYELPSKITDVGPPNMETPIKVTNTDAEEYDIVEEWTCQ